MLYRAARLLELIQAISHRGHLGANSRSALSGGNERPVILDRDVLFESADAVCLSLEQLGLLRAEKFGKHSREKSRGTLFATDSGREHLT